MVIEIPEICPTLHRKNNIGAFHYTFCVQCQSLFLDAFTICPECRSEDVVCKRLNPYWIISLGFAGVIDYKIDTRVDFNPVEDDPELTNQTYKFPRESWEYIFVSASCFSRNDISWWLDNRADGLSTRDKV